MHSWNTLPESYQQTVYEHSQATVKCQIRQAENATPAMVISNTAAHIDNAIPLDTTTSKSMIEEPEIGLTDTNVPIDNNCTDDELYCGMPGCSGHSKHEGGKCNEGDDIPTSRRRWWTLTEIQRYDLGTSDVDGYGVNDGDIEDADEMEETSQADDGSMQHFENSEYSTRVCEDWTVYFRPVQYDHGEANEMASDASEAKSTL